ncbi:MAG: hypothetical protein J2P37_25885 [Ktedonobacteraceae bacterium]|nr:hypothetical protein [Ktedonobacteraceae bacterium]MBO0794174.1 hypothetical protein [Ktedonobacteraceae bacterium]
MSQDTDKYLHFNVGLLKDSFALEALWQDAMKYHMIDQPGKLIALRLTEYYEMLSKGLIQTGGGSPLKTPPTPPPTPITNGANGEAEMGQSFSEASQTGEHTSLDGNIVTASPDVDQNADEAAEYWALL